MTTAFANVLAFAAAAAVLVATPGLDTTVVLRQATVEGPKSAALAACGVVTGLLVWGISAAAGLSAVTSPARPVGSLRGDRVSSPSGYKSQTVAISVSNQ